MVDTGIIVCLTNVALQTNESLMDERIEFSEEIQPHMHGAFSKKICKRNIINLLSLAKYNYFDTNPHG